jgi:hypothetical protein
MKGKIVRIVPSGNFVTIIIRLEEAGKCGRTYTGKNFRNFAMWGELKIGDLVDGLRWLNGDKGIIDGDSPVHLI